MKTLSQEIAESYLRKISDFTQGTTLKTKLILSTIQFLNVEGFAYHDEMGRQYAFITAILTGMNKGKLAVLLCLDEYRNSSWNNFRIHDINFTPENGPEESELSTRVESNYVLPVESTKSFMQDFREKEAEHERDLLLNKAEKRLRTEEERKRSRRERIEYKKRIREEKDNERKEALNYVLPNPSRDSFIGESGKEKPVVNDLSGFDFSSVLRSSVKTKRNYEAKTGTKRPRKNALLVKNGVLVSGIAKNYHKPRPSLFVHAFVSRP